jgi:hypothetical protein
MAKRILTLLMVVTMGLALLAQAAWSQPTPSASTVVTLSVDKYVAIRIPPKTGGYQMTVPTDWIAEKKVRTLAVNVPVEAISNCGTWVRVPMMLDLQDHGTYHAEAVVTVDPLVGSGATPDFDDGTFYYQNFTTAFGASWTPIISARVAVVKNPWSAADLAGTYWQSLYVDIMASDASSYPTTGWPVNVEPTDPPHH